MTNFQLQRVLTSLPGACGLDRYFWRCSAKLKNIALWVSGKHLQFFRVCIVLVASPNQQETEGMSNLSIK